MDHESTHFGDWLRAEIEERTLTQAQFAKNCGISFWTLRNWLGLGSPAIRGTNVVRLARGLGLTRAEVESRLHRDGTVAA